MVGLEQVGGGAYETVDGRWVAARERKWSGIPFVPVYRIIEEGSGSRMSDEPMLTKDEWMERLHVALDVIGTRKALVDVDSLLSLVGIPGSRSRGRRVESRSRTSCLRPQNPQTGQVASSPEGTPDAD